MCNLNSFEDIFKYNKVTGIYYIINVVTGRKYVGSSINLYRRYSNHNKNTSNKKLSVDFKIYGKEKFYFIVAETFENITKEQLNQAEYRYLCLYGAKEYVESKRKDRRFSDFLYNAYAYPTA